MEAAFTFPDADKYAFIYYEAHLLLMAFDRDDAKFLFVINHEGGDPIRLKYPGQTFTDRVLDDIERIFFVTLEEPDRAPTRLVLGSLFEVSGKRFGAYYEAGAEQPEVVLFEVHGTAPEYELRVPEEAVYETASRVFAERYGDLLRIKET